MDEETGLYYYGARYLDPRTSRWLSADPALGEYIPGAPVNEEAKKANGNLPGMGGVFNVVNFQLYHYAGNNPVKYVDPDGREIIVGISTAKKGPDPTGQHVFIMYIDPDNSENNVMLDAAGRFGEGRTSDILDGHQEDISIENYVTSFTSAEILTVFKVNLSPENEQKIKDLIVGGVNGDGNRSRSGFPDCAKKASNLLAESGLFPEVKNRLTPKGLLGDMIKYAENNQGNVKVEKYDFETKKRIDE